MDSVQSQASACLGDLNGGTDNTPARISEDRRSGPVGEMHITATRLADSKTLSKTCRQSSVGMGF